MATHGRVQRLDPKIAALIRAGEVVVSPAHALKELLENALDAGAKSIQVTMLDAGLKKLQIQDDGKGITKEDLPQLCQRHMTSKLVRFEDLQEVPTFGFRGEALASLAVCGIVTIQSTREGEDVGYKCKWRDGKLVPCDGAANTEPLPCPGKRGTTVTVESLFMNTQNRLGALTAKISETQANVEAVVKAYAVANPTVSFSLKKTHHQSAQTSVVLQTRAVPSGDAQGIVAQLYGAALSDKLKLLSLDSDHPPANGSVLFSPPTGAWQSRMKKLEVWIFINKRWVKQEKLKKAITNAYQTVYGVKGCPFVLLTLTLPPRDVDINMNPAKETVGLMHETEVVTLIRRKIEHELKEMRGDAPPPVPPPAAASPATPSPSKAKRSLDKGSSGKEEKKTPPKKSVASSYPSMDAFLAKPLKQAALHANSPKASGASPSLSSAGDGAAAAAAISADPFDADFAPAPAAAAVAPASAASIGVVTDEPVARPGPFADLLSDAPAPAAPNASNNTAPAAASGARLASPPFPSPARSPAAALASRAPPSAAVAKSNSFNASSLLTPHSKPTTAYAAPADGDTIVARPITLNSAVPITATAPSDAPNSMQRLLNSLASAKPAAIAAALKPGPSDQADQSANPDVVMVDAAGGDGAEAQKKASNKKKRDDTLTSLRNPKRKFALSQLSAVRAGLSALAEAEHKGLKRLVTEGRLVSAVGCSMYILLDNVVWRLNGEEASAALVAEYAWRKWQQFDAYTFPQPLPLRELLEIAYAEAGATEASLGKPVAEAIEEVVALLGSKANLLRDYWRISIESDCLCSLPIIVDGLVPHMSGLPRFLARLFDVDWVREAPCYNDMVDALSEFYRIRHTHYRLWEQQTIDADEEEAHPLEREFTPPTKAMLQQLSQMKASGDQNVFYWRKQGDDPLQRALDLAERKRVAVFSKIYNVSGKYYIVQEAGQFFRSVIEPHKEEEQRSFEEMIPPDVPVKFFMEVTYPRSQFNQNPIEAILRALRTEVTQQWQRDTGKKGADDGWIEFDRSDVFTIGRVVYNPKMSFKNIDHLYTFVRRLEAVMEAKKESSESGRLLYVQREKRKKLREELIFSSDAYAPKRPLTLPWCCAFNGPIAHPVPTLGGMPSPSPPERDVFLRCLVTYAVPTPFAYPDTDVQPRTASPKRAKAAPIVAPVSTQGSPDYALEHAVWPALRHCFSPPKAWEAAGISAVAFLDAEHEQ